MTSRSYETKVKLQQRMRNSAGTRGNRMMKRDNDRQDALNETRIVGNYPLALCRLRSCCSMLC